MRISDWSSDVCSSDLAHQRRMLMVMTDGIADNPKLCEDVITVLAARGVEVVAIGINNDSVRKWCRNSHVIDAISQLPQALLACIDARAGKNSLRKAASRLVQSHFPTTRSEARGGGKECVSRCR